MTRLTLTPQAAHAFRNGAIDAAAALDDALRAETVLGRRRR